MTGYTKLFHSILASTVWREPNEVRLVWITMMAMADRCGIVEASVPGLADLARVPVEACRFALERLLAPDPDSRSTEEEGRRIRVVDGGWQLINHPKYRAKMSADDRREYLRLKQQQYRSRKRASTPSQHPSTNVAVVASGQHIAEAEADPDPKAKDRSITKTLKPRPKTFGRITLHLFQLEKLIAMLGPHAATFDLDEWVYGLSEAADRDGLVLDGDNEKLWAWVRGELTAECQRRGMKIASAATSGKAPSRSDQLTAMLARVAALDAKGGGQ